MAKTKNREKDPIVCGIYCISFDGCKQSYVGSSKNICKRGWEHRISLEGNYHPNKKLQNAYNKYGGFSFHILEETLLKKEELLKLEQEYLNAIFLANKDDIYFREYSLNLSKTTVGNSGVRLIAENHPCHRKIDVYDLNENYIETVCGLRETERKYSTFSVKLCCQGKQKSSKGFIFKYNNEYIKRIKKIKTVCDRDKWFFNLAVEEFDKVGNFIKVWNNCKEIVDTTNISKRSLRRQLVEKSIKVSKKDRVFKFKETN